jgi:uncharacterized membrane protein (DUF441 family)
VGLTVGRKWGKATSWLAPRRKAIVAVATPIIVFAAAKHGLNLTDEQAIAAATLITGGATYAVPNA